MCALSIPFPLQIMRDIINARMQELGSAAPGDEKEGGEEEEIERGDKKTSLSNSNSVPRDYRTTSNRETNFSERHRSHDERREGGYSKGEVEKTTSEFVMEYTAHRHRERSRSRERLKGRRSRSRERRERRESERQQRGHSSDRDKHHHRSVSDRDRHDHKSKSDRDRHHHRSRSRDREKSHEKKKEKRKHRHRSKSKERKVVERKRSSSRDRKE